MDAEEKTLWWARFAQTHEFAVQQASFKWLSSYLERITVWNYHTGGFSAETHHSIAFHLQFSFVRGSFQTIIYFFLPTPKNIHSDFSNLMGFFYLVGDK